MLAFKDIVSISGKSGLYKIIGRRNNGLIVESLDGTNKKFATSLTQKLSVLEDISIYTYEGDIKLKEVFQLLHTKVEGGLALPDKTASNDACRAFLRTVLPNFDEEKVYVSDIQKLISWYGILIDKVSLEEEKPEDAETEEKPKEKKTKPKAKKS